MRLRAAGLGLVLVAAGCGGGSTPAKVDTKTIEQQIDKQLSTPQTAVTSVSCPSDVEAKEGATFTCSVQWANGATGKVQATQRAGATHTTEPVSGSVQVPGSVIEQQLESDLAKRGFPTATANCPDTVIVKLDTTATCDVSGAGAAGTVTYGFTSETGAVDPATVKTG